MLKIESKLLNMQLQYLQHIYLQIESKAYNEIKVDVIPILFKGNPNLKELIDDVYPILKILITLKSDKVQKD